MNVSENNYCEDREGCDEGEVSRAGFCGGDDSNCVSFVRTITSPERKLRITDGRVSRENPDPVLAHRAR